MISESRGDDFRPVTFVTDGLEGLFGSIYLDSDLETTRAVVFILFPPFLHNVPDPETLNDPKTRLQ